ncbi:uncharacterized protein [Dermacentor albipictus]|uniref:uncharacterized protein isoform X2 n=1 Tax=Dermacentor albipictus TaxID=60249 RepID=UPI0031FDACCC
MSPVARARSAYLLLVILVAAGAERSFDYDVDDLDQVESFIWDASEAPHMGPSRPAQHNQSPAENLVGTDPNLHRQVSEIVRQIIAEYSHRNQLPAGIWVGGKHMGPGMHHMPYPPQNPCFPPIGLQIPIIPWKMDHITPRGATNNNDNINLNNNNGNNQNNNHDNNNNNGNSVAGKNNNNDKPQPGSLPPLPPYQKPAWRPAVPVFPIPTQPQQHQNHQAPLKNPQSQPGVKTSFSISTSHPVPLPKRDLHTPLVPWRSAAPAPADQQSAGQQTLPLPIRPPKLASHFRFAQPPRPSGRGHGSRRGQHQLPQKTGVSSLPKNLPADDVYYASQSSKLPRKVIKQAVFEPKRKQQVGETITLVEQGKNGEWFKLPVNKVSAGLGRRNYEVVELHKEEDVRKVGQGLGNGEESIHYIHIQER